MMGYSEVAVDSVMRTMSRAPKGGVLASGRGVYALHFNLTVCRLYVEVVALGVGLCEWRESKSEACPGRPRERRD